MVWTSKNCPKRPVSPEDRGELMEPQPVAWMVERESDRTFPRFYRTKAGANAMAKEVTTVWPKAKVTPLYTAAALSRPKREPGQAAVNPLQALYDEVNALGGRPDQDNSYDQGIVDTVAKVLDIIEKAQAAYSFPSTNRVCPRCKIELLDPVLLGTPEEGHICGTCWAEDRQSALSSTYPRCTCAAIVNPNIPHARSCPLSRPECK